MPKVKTVYVGMSGGVDSSVSAALVQAQGYNAVGVFMKNWTADVMGFECPWRQDLTDAQSVAAKLKIPLKIFDFQKQYKQKVVDYMVDGFRAGITPNPDIVCNQEIKFKLFLETALADGADMIATGHYARVNNAGLMMASDKSKDQSYFLYRISEKALRKTLFPVGEYRKTAVRALAKKYDLPTANKPDSMGICFVGQVDIKDFLKQFIKTKPGLIMDEKTNSPLGEHDGAIFYTIGQRHGLGVGGGKPLYVTRKDIRKNVVYVTEDPGELELYGQNIRLTDVHWINGPPTANRSYQVRVRHTGKLTNCTVPRSNLVIYRLKLEKPERAITPGQSAVIYDQEKVVGGGIISNLAP